MRVYSVCVYNKINRQPTHCESGFENIKELDAKRLHIPIYCYQNTLVYNRLMPIGIIEI